MEEKNLLNEMELARAEGGLVMSIRGEEGCVNGGYPAAPMPECKTCRYRKVKSYNADGTPASCTCERAGIAWDEL